MQITIPCRRDVLIMAILLGCPERRLNDVVDKALSYPYLSAYTLTMCIEQAMVEMEV